MKLERITPSLISMKDFVMKLEIELDQLLSDESVNNYYTKNTRYFEVIIIAKEKLQQENKVVNLGSEELLKDLTDEGCPKAVRQYAFYIGLHRGEVTIKEIASKQSKEIIETTDVKSYFRILKDAKIFSEVNE